MSNKETKTHVLHQMQTLSQVDCDVMQIAQLWQLSHYINQLFCRKFKCVLIVKLNDHDEQMREIENDV